MSRIPSTFRDYALSSDFTVSNYILSQIYIHLAASRSTEAFGENCDCRNAQRKWILGNVLLRKIRRMQLYPSRRKRLKLREREREVEKGRRGRARIEASERIVEAERDLEPWKAPIAIARVRLPSKTRFIPQLLEPQSGERIQILNVTNTPKRY